MLPFLEGNWFLTKFLCSDVGWDDEDVEFEGLYSQIKSDMKTNVSFSVQIASQLVKIFDEAYVEFLEEKMGYFGRKSGLWEEAYNLYFEEITMKVQELVGVSGKDVGKYTERECWIWNRLPGALEFVRNQFVDEELFLPPDIGSIPFLSPAATSGLVASFEEVQMGYSLVCC